MRRPDSLPVTALLTLLVAAGAISTDLYLPSLPAIGRAFASDPAEVQLTLSVFLVGFALSQIAYGPLSDRFGRRPILLGGMALYFLATLACLLASDIHWLIGARFFQAMGACAGVVLGRAVVRDVHGREQAARMLSYMGVAMALAPALGPILGGLLQVWFGWRANFAVLALFGAVCVLGVWSLLPETNRWRDPEATKPWRIFANYLSLAANRTYLGYVLVCAFAYAGIFAFISGSSFVLIDGLGLTPDLYGLCFAAVVVGYMVGAFVSGRLTVRVGLERLVLAGTVVGALAGGLAFAFSLAGLFGVWPIIGPVFLFLVGAGLMLPNSMAGAIGPFPAMAGAASAFLGFVQMSLAALVGIAVGHFTDGSALAMTAALAMVGLGALLAYVVLVRAHARGDEGEAADA